MTLFRLQITRDAPVGGTQPVVGVIGLSPTDGPETIFTDVIPPDQPVVDIEPSSPGAALKVTEYVRGEKETVYYVIVPDDDAIIDLSSRTHVNPTTLGAVQQPEAAWWAAIEGFVRLHRPPLTQDEYEALPQQERDRADVLYLLRADTP